VLDLTQCATHTNCSLVLAGSRLAFHAAPLALNLLANARLRLAMGNGTQYRIDAHNHPLPYVSLEELVGGHFKDGKMNFCSEFRGDKARARGGPDERGERRDELGDARRARAAHAQLGHLLGAHLHPQ